MAGKKKTSTPPPTGKELSLPYLRQGDLRGACVHRNQEKEQAAHTF